MVDITDFNALFAFDPKFSFSNNSQSQITSNRHALGGVLFYDRLLELLQIKCKSYPPTSNKDLRELHKSIVDSPIADHHKHSLLYYLLLDCNAHLSPSSRSRRGASDRQASVASSTAGENPAEVFARQVHLSEKYSFTIQGLWNMDRTQFKPALDYLCQPSLIPTFPEAVMEALMANQQHSLAIAYLNTMGMTFNVTALEDGFRMYFQMIADSSIANAYVFLQNQPVIEKRELFEMMIESALRPPIKSGKSGTIARTERCAQLVDLPLSAEEQEWFEEFLVKGEGRNLQGATETVATRWIAIGKIKEARELTAGSKDEIKFDEQTKIAWPQILDGLDHGMGEAGRIDGLWNEELVSR